MDRTAICTALRERYAAFAASVNAIGTAKLDVPPNGKWSPAQQLEHIHRAVRPVALALLVPKWFLRWRFGTPNRAPRTYDAVVARYKEKLAAGGRASGPFIPPHVAGARVPGLSREVQATVETLCGRVGRWKETDLDRYLLPHPLLGKLTVREMLYFTIHHARHHQELVERDQQAVTAS